LVEEADDTGLDPLVMTNKALGGGDYEAALGFGQQGVLGGVGLNNIGLLVKTTGWVTEKDTSASPAWFRIDDGSGVGVKVFGSVPSGTPYVTVTGISSCEKPGPGSDVLRSLLATGIQVL
jgi:hypothetical protein